LKPTPSTFGKPRSSRSSADFATTNVHINYIKSITQNKSPKNVLIYKQEKKNKVRFDEEKVRLSLSFIDKDLRRTRRIKDNYM
jgi:hypothetical protein